MGTVWETRMVPPRRRDPWFALAVAALGVATLWAVAGAWSATRPALPPVVPAPEVQVIVTLPPWPTPERTPTVTPYPTRPPTATATSWPVYDPRYATPGRIYRMPPPPPPTPTPLPACARALEPGALCVAPTLAPTWEG